MHKLSTETLTSKKISQYTVSPRKQGTHYNLIIHIRYSVPYAYF